MELAIMIEGQNGLDWQHWMRLGPLVEELGFAGLFRSDHYTNATPPDKASLELWTSLTWLADHTQRIEFGPLVSPVSFRHPTQTARMAAAVDDLSGGRLVLGIGGGWQAREHENFGWQLLDIPQRFTRFEEGLEVITRLLTSETPVSYQGTFFQLHEAILLPRPHRPGGPPILVGGNGLTRTLPLVVRFAKEWNANFIPVEKFRQLNRALDDLLLAQNRQPGEVRRSLMTGCIYGKDQDEVERKVFARTKGRLDIAALRARGTIVGTVGEIQDYLAEIHSAGAQRVMLQWLELDDYEGLKSLGKGIIG
jgi:F420-dependent oxidoreductase-like protein